MNFGERHGREFIVRRIIARLTSYLLLVRIAVPGLVLNDQCHDIILLTGGPNGKESVNDGRDNGKTRCGPRCRTFVTPSGVDSVIILTVAPLGAAKEQILASFVAPSYDEGVAKRFVLDSYRIRTQLIHYFFARLMHYRISPADYWLGPRL